MIKLTSEQFNILSKVVLEDKEISQEEIKESILEFYLGICAISMFHKKHKNITECYDILYNQFLVED